MGMPASPVGLDIVCITAEIRRFQSNTFNLKLHTSDNYIVLPSSNTFLHKYLRYQDDTKAIASSEEIEDLRNIVLNIGTLFPQRIPINIDLFHNFGTFLDVAFLRKLSTNKIELFPKKKISSPLTFINAKSMSPNRFKFGTLYSELVRTRRICSQKHFIPIFDNLLLREFNAMGYNSISKKMKKFIKLIQERFDENMFRLPAAPSEKRTVYGSTSILDKSSGSHRVVRKLIKDSLGKIDATLPSLISSTKLKCLIYSKRIYLKKMNMK